VRQRTFGVVTLALALSAAAPQAGHAQAFNPAQAAAIAQGVLGLVYHAMNPAPVCGPHDNWGHPYQPPPPSYHPQPLQPPASQPRSFTDDDDDDDGDLKPLKPHPTHNPSADVNQDETRSYQDADESGQPEVRASQRKAAAQRQRTPTYDAQDGGASGNGQVAEIPSLRPPTRTDQAGRAGSQPSQSYNFGQ
jgi:hypothetical protein